MAGNFLEELVSQWYDYSGYFIRRNILVGKRAQGGYEGELDVVAFNPATDHLIHIESSMDSHSWSKRSVRYTKKFKLGRTHIPHLFKGMKLPEKIDQVALLGYASKRNHTELAGGRILLVSELLEEIFVVIKSLDISRSAIPEHLSIIRGYQFAASNFTVIHSAMTADSDMDNLEFPNSAPTETGHTV